MDGDVAKNRLGKAGVPYGETDGFPGLPQLKIYTICTKAIANAKIIKDSSMWLKSHTGIIPPHKIDTYTCILFVYDMGKYSVNTNLSKEEQWIQ